MLHFLLLCRFRPRGRPADDGHGPTFCCTACSNYHPLKPVHMFLPLPVQTAWAPF